MAAWAWRRFSSHFVGVTQHNASPSWIGNFKRRASKFVSLDHMEDCILLLLFAAGFHSFSVIGIVLGAQGSEAWPDLYRKRAQ